MCDEEADEAESPRDDGHQRRGALISDGQAREDTYGMRDFPEEDDDTEESEVPSEPIEHLRLLSRVNASRHDTGTVKTTPMYR